MIKLKSLAEVLGESKVDEVEKFTRDNLLKIEKEVNSKLANFMNFDFKTLDMDEKKIGSDLGEIKKLIQEVVNKMIAGKY